MTGFLSIVLSEAIVFTKCCPSSITMLFNGTNVERASVLGVNVISIISPEKKFCRSPISISTSNFPLGDRVGFIDVTFPVDDVVVEDTATNVPSFMKSTSSTDMYVFALSSSMFSIVNRICPGAVMFPFSACMLVTVPEIGAFILRAFAWREASSAPVSACRMLESS